MASSNTIQKVTSPIKRIFESANLSNLKPQVNPSSISALSVSNQLNNFKISDTLRPHVLNPLPHDKENKHVQPIPEDIFAAPEEAGADFEEKLPNRMVLLPTTPGSLYGGSRNIMKHNKEIRTK
jgi:hypothetical protein